MRTPAVLLILDGYGLAEPSEHNAVENAHTPALKRLRQACSSRLEASGEAVGLRAGLMGSSEVNHLNMGAGRVVEQDILRIDRAIERGDLAASPVLAAAIQTPGELHLVGLLSDGGIHSHIDHLRALLDIVEGRRERPVHVHAILDGRDTDRKAAAQWLEELEKRPSVRIASVMGRYFAMDRDKRWDRTEQAYDVMTGNGPEAQDWRAVLDATYAEEKSDEFVTPTRLGQPVRSGDAVVFFNFRSDRPRQLTSAFTQKDFPGFPRKTVVDTYFVRMTEYDEAQDLPTLFPPFTMRNVLSEWLSEQAVTQLHIAETEKYAHVTFFFNGGREEPFPGEDRAIVASPSVATYDQQPEMSVHGITEKVVADVWDHKHDAYVINFANSDMVGHTGDYAATVKALEAMDGCVAQIEEAVLAAGGFLIVTADHGNAEDMHAERTTTHTTNPVPFMVSGIDVKLRDGSIPDVAPTFLELMGLPVPPEMTARSLLD